MSVAFAAGIPISCGHVSWEVQDRCKTSFAWTDAEAKSSLINFPVSDLSFRPNYLPVAGKVNLA